MTDRDRDEMQALLDQFRKAMARENEAQLFDQDARKRIGEMIGKATREGGADFGYLPQRKE
jgi:hypothetical protein